MSSDVAVIAPPESLPKQSGTIYIPQRFATSALPIYIERALRQIFAPLRVGRESGRTGLADSREGSPVAAPMFSHWQPASKTVAGGSEGMGSNQKNTGEGLQSSGWSGQLSASRLQLVYGRQVSS
jgi:hypothetical protein